MGFRLHRSIKLLPGLRLNLSKSGLGLSTGIKGFHVSQSPTGRRRRTISIPGTGMSWISYGSGDSTRHPAPRGASTAPTDADPPAKPGLFAPRAEKDLYAAVIAQDPVAVERIANTEQDLALAAATLAGLLWIRIDEDAKARKDLQWVFDTGRDPGEDRFLRRYAPVMIRIVIVEGATASLPIDRSSAGLMLAELLQLAGEPGGAIDVVEALEPTVATALSLAELYAATGRFDDVIDLTEDAPNVDEATSLLWVFRGIAFRQKQQYAAARACFAKVTRCRSRDPIVLHRARFERAKCYLAEGKKARARKDLGRIRAEDSDYVGLDAVIADLDSAS